MKGHSFTKLPGGGLEFGEGTRDCVVREFKEETGLKVEVQSHFYTTDFFVLSAFDESHQVISIYYLVSVAEGKAPEQVDSLEPYQTFEWFELSKLSKDDFTFPIDKSIIDELKKLGEE